ncbi:hypothetical protein D039_0530B, partial [Vibrio parahaemolyticus EKP-028]
LILFIFSLESHQTVNDVRQMIYLCLKLTATNKLR